MTDRINYLTVALDRDIRSDDAEALLSAIRQLRGVLKIEPNVVSGEAWVIEERVRSELSRKLWDVLHPKERK